MHFGGGRQGTLCGHIKRIAASHLSTGADSFVIMSRRRDLRVRAHLVKLCGSPNASLPRAAPRSRAKTRCKQAQLREVPLAHLNQKADLTPECARRSANRFTQVERGLLDHFTSSCLCMIHSLLHFTSLRPSAASRSRAEAGSWKLLLFSCTRLLLPSSYQLPAPCVRFASLGVEL